MGKLTRAAHAPCALSLRHRRLGVNARTGIRIPALAAIVLAVVLGSGSPLPGGVASGGLPPGRPGSFCGCETIVEKPGRFFPYWSAYVYLPVAPDSGCAVECRRGAFPSGKAHPLVVIYHAIDTLVGNNASSYAALGRHLASHGFVVASLAHNIQLDDAIPFLHSVYGAALSDDVALFGHSAGGDLMVKRAHDVPALGLDLRAMVLMAPRTNDTTDYSLPYTDALLGLHWTRDNDSATWGAPGVPGRRSVFRIYDRAGVVWNKPDELTLTKDFVFFDFPSGGHLQQDRLGIIAYTTAFLRRRLYGELAQDAYLQRSQPIETVFGSDLPFSQMHAEPNRLVIANFEEGQDAIPDVYDGVYTPGVVAAPPWPSWTDSFSPHDTGVLEFKLAPDADRRQVAVLMNSFRDVTAYRYLSFRIGQRYHDTANPSGTDVDFQIEIQISGQDAAVWASAYQPLRFPVVVNPLVINQTGAIVNGTKNAMRTYVVPLADFPINDWTRVGAVVFDFSQAPAAELRFVLDDVEFIP